MKLGEEQLKGGATDVSAVLTRMTEYLDGDDVSIDYVKICSADTLEELDKPIDRMVALVAAKVGTTRLIDNVIIELYAGFGLPGARSKRRRLW